MMLTRCAKKVQPDIVSFDLLSSENDKVLCSSHHETHEFVAQQLLNLVGLFDGYRDADRVDARFDLETKNAKERFINSFITRLQYTRVSLSVVNRM